MSHTGHGGARPGAGRKSDAEIARLRSLAARAIDDDTWLAILRGLAEQAQFGDARCAQLLIRYAFGVSPTQPSQPARPLPPNND